jgi:hypothetical protein
VAVLLLVEPLPPKHRLPTTIMKYFLISAVILGTNAIITPCYAQFSSFSSGSENCSNLCLKLDVGSANGLDSFSNGFNNGASNSSSSLQWKAGITWRPNAPEVLQGEAERAKQRLEDNRSLTVALAEAIAQNKTELAHGLAILLAPRLNYRDPLLLLAALKEGSNNMGAALPPSNEVVNSINSNVIELK